MSREYHPIIWALITIGSIILGARILSVEINGAFLLPVLTAVVGYVTVHVLDIRKETRLEKMRNYLSLIKGLRLFVLETDFQKSAERRAELRDRFQDTYLPTCLLISKNGYSKFRELADALIALLANQKDEKSLQLFKKKQSEFINLLREELDCDGDIDFTTFDIRLSEAAQMQMEESHKFDKPISNEENARVANLEEKQWKQSSFTVDFHFSNGVAHCEGFDMETVVSNALKLKYRMLVRHPVDGKLYTMKGMEAPMRESEVQKALENQHNGHIDGKEFVFEVFDETGERQLFATKFNVEEKIPPEGYGNEHLVVQSFSWIFDLPSDLQPVAKQAIENHLSRKVTI